MDPGILFTKILPTLCTLMDFPIHIDTTSMGLPIVYFKGAHFEFSKNLLLSLKIVLILGNSADPDEMQHDAAFHLGLHCLPKYSSRCLHYRKRWPYK